MLSSLIRGIDDLFQFLFDFVDARYESFAGNVIQDGRVFKIFQMFFFTKKTADFDRVHGDPLYLG